MLFFFSIITSCYGASSDSRKRFRIDGEDSVVPPTFTLDELSDFRAQRIGWKVQRIFAVCAQLAASVRVRSTKERVDLFNVLWRPRACFRFLSDEEEKDLLGRGESKLYAFVVSMTRSREDFFHLVQVLLSSVSATLRAFSRDYLEGFCVAVLFSELCTTAARNERE